MECGERRAASAGHVEVGDQREPGRLDLLVNNYVQWSPETDIWCTLDGDSKTFCTPESYTGNPSKLYRNLGKVNFDDWAAEAGVSDPSSKALGAAILDVNSDGWPDIFQANDTKPNKLYVNRQDGTFEDVSGPAGIFSEYGSGLGVVTADFDGNGWPDIFVANDGMANFLWFGQGDGTFRNGALLAGVAVNSCGQAEASRYPNGAAPMAARSERFTRSSLRATRSGGQSRKCRPWIMVSTVATRRSPVAIGRTAASLCRPKVPSVFAASGAI